MSNVSLPNLARQGEICRCELRHVTKSHWQIYNLWQRSAHSVILARVNRYLCRIHLTKFHDIGV